MPGMKINHPAVLTMSRLADSPTAPQTPARIMSSGHEPLAPATEDAGLSSSIHVELNWQIAVQQHLETTSYCAPQLVRPRSTNVTKRSFQAIKTGEAWAAQLVVRVH